MATIIAEIIFFALWTVTVIWCASKKSAEPKSKTISALAMSTKTTPIEKPPEITTGVQKPIPKSPTPPTPPPIGEKEKNLSPLNPCSAEKKDSKEPSKIIIIQSKEKDKDKSKLKSDKTQKTEKTTKTTNSKKKSKSSSAEKVEHPTPPVVPLPPPVVKKPSVAKHAILPEEPFSLKCDREVSPRIERSALHFSRRKPQLKKPSVVVEEVPDSTQPSENEKEREQEKLNENCDK